MVEIGANLVKGLWEGIKSLATWIWDKVSNWASNLWNGIKNFFGIHSPSKKMAWIGDMLMEGLAGGIDESAGEVIDSANAMTRDLNRIRRPECGYDRSAYGLQHLQIGERV